MVKGLHLLFRQQLGVFTICNLEQMIGCRCLCSCSNFFRKCNEYFLQIFDHGNLDILVAREVQIHTEVVMDFSSRYGDSRSVNLGQYLDSLSIHISIFVADLQVVNVLTYRLLGAIYHPICHAWVVRIQYKTHIFEFTN